jgi:hypothetical protein
LPAHPSHTTARTEPYTAVGRVKLRPGGESRQAASASKEGPGQDLADRRVLAEPPRPEVAAGGFLCPLATHPALLQLCPPSLNVLPMRSQHRPQLAPSAPSYDRDRGYTRGLGVKQIRPKGRSEILAARAIDAGSEVKSRQGEHLRTDTPPRMLESLPGV